MSQTVTFPDLWLLIAPCGCIDGFMRSVNSGTVNTPTAHAAWVKFTPLKRDRTREVKQGYVCRGGDFAEWNGRSPQDCPHEPQWGIPIEPATPSPNDYSGDR